MIYIDDTRLPESLRTDGGLGLCKLWSLTYLGSKLSEELINNLSSEFDRKLSIEEYSKYKIVRCQIEVLNISDEYFIGDGFGNIIYSPNRDSKVLKDYKNGYLPIKSKFIIKSK